MSKSKAVDSQHVAPGELMGLSAARALGVGEPGSDDSGRVLLVDVSRAVRRLAEDRESGETFSMTAALRDLSLVRASLPELVPFERGELLEAHATLDRAMIDIGELMDRDAALRELFLGIVGHDLRASLGNIMVGAEMVTAHEGVTDAHAARTIARSARRLCRMTDDLLDFTRAREAGGIPIRRAPADVHSVCRDVIAEFELSQPGGRVRFEGKGDGRGSWDEDRLAQVLSNLIGNALEHGDPRAPVLVRALDPNARFVRLEVHNEGPPISPELIPHLFDPFRGAGGKALGVGSRLGLGLYIVDRVVLAHGGTVRVTSERELGTTFTVDLPREERSTREPPRKQESGIARRMPRILIVDDDPLVAGALARVLRDDGNIDVAEGGAQALALMRAGASYDIILCDVCMPGMSGLDLHSALRVELPRMADRVVFMTGGAPADLHARLETLPNRVLDKPVDTKRLASVLVQAVGLQSA